MFQILKNYITQVWIFSKTYIQMWNKVCAEKCNYHWSKGIGCSRSKYIKITIHVQIVNRFTGSYKLSIVAKNRLIHPIREFSSYLILCTVHRHRPQESRWWMGWWHSGTQASQVHCIGWHIVYSFFFLKPRSIYPDCLGRLAQLSLLILLHYRSHCWSPLSVK